PVRRVRAARGPGRVPAADRVGHRVELRPAAAVARARDRSGFVSPAGARPRPRPGRDRGDLRVARAGAEAPRPGRHRAPNDGRRRGPARRDRRRTARARGARDRVRARPPAHMAPGCSGLAGPGVRGARDRGDRDRLAGGRRRRVHAGHAQPRSRPARRDRPADPRRHPVRRPLPAPAAGRPGRRGPTMTSIFRRALGSDFERLHPEIQRRFGFDSTDGIASIGTGVMDEVWRGGFWTVPFLYVGTWRRIMFPEVGRNIPFTIENYAFVDDFGRETMSLIRTFESDKRRRFDAYMVYSEARGRIVDYLGSHEHLAVDLDLSVEPDGGLRIRSGDQRFYEGPIGVRFPAVFSGTADVREWYDDEARCFGISVDVRNRRWGRLFGYRGTFDAAWPAIAPGSVPAHILPIRQERRD